MFCWGDGYHGQLGIEKAAGEEDLAPVTLAIQSCCSCTGQDASNLAVELLSAPSDQAQ